MLKDVIINLFYDFEMEYWKFSDGKDPADIEYIYSLLPELNNLDESNIKPFYDKLVSIMGMIRFKSGFESMVINDNKDLSELKKIISDISLDSDDIVKEYNYVLSVYENYLGGLKNADFIDNKYNNDYGEEGLYLAVESLKSLIGNENYRKMFEKQQVREILTDCVKLNNGKVRLENLELKYKEVIDEIWKKSLTNGVDENGNFRMLFSNISGGNLRYQAELLLNRPEQSSCSMVSSDYVAIYGSKYRRIGFVYPNDSQILMSSAYDLSSNVFGDGFKNKEKGTLLATPEAIEKIGKERTIESGGEPYSSECYNEVLVKGKPCGIAIIGLGEKDLNIDDIDAKILSGQTNLPLQYVDTMNYKNELSDNDKEYIAYHSIMSYLGLSSEELLDNSEVINLIKNNKDQIADIFLTLKREGTLSKDSMCQTMENILNLSNKSGRSR